jgi:protein-tyrosine phosphatase
VVSEYAFFANNSALGQFLFWHMVGTKSHPAASVFTSSLHYLASTYADWGTDRLVERVEVLRAMLFKRQLLPQVIFFHCDCGCDRTGQLAGSYMMRFHNSTWDSVVAYNQVVAGRPQTCPTHRQMQWYCVYLNRFLGYNSTGDCLKQHLCTPI